MKKATDIKHKKIKLSCLIESLTPQDKISLANRQISIIDLVPQRFHHLKVIYLSQNFISTIQHIIQFPNLKVLSLSYNSISDLNQTAAFSDLKYLQILNLSGNPICKNFLYNCYTIGACNSLQKLDNALIKGNCKYLKQQRVKISKLFEQLINNYHLIISLYQKIGSKFENKTNQAIWQCLYKDCQQIFSQMNKNKDDKIQSIFQEAMNNLLDRQLDKIQQMTNQSQQEDEKLFYQAEQLPEEEYQQQRSQQQQSQQKPEIEQIYVYDRTDMEKQSDIEQQQQQNYQTNESLQENIVEGIQKLLNLYLQRICSSMTTIYEEANIHIKSQSLQDHLILKKASKFFKLLFNLSQADKQQNEIRFKILVQKRETKALKKKFLNIWKTQFANHQISQQSTFLYQRLNEFKQKQVRYLQKIALLEELVQVNKTKRQSLSNFSSQIKNRQDSFDRFNKQNTKGDASSRKLTSSRIVKQKMIVPLSDQKVGTILQKRLGINLTRQGYTYSKYI